MPDMRCKNCGEKLWPENPYLGESHRVYAHCKCEGCGREFEAVYELVDLIAE